MDERVQRAIDDEQFDAAVDALAAVEAERALWPHELLLKSRCLQLHPMNDARFLAAAKDALVRALEIDAEYVPAWIELGWFHLNVEGKAVEALSAFEKAANLVTAVAAEALIGLARSTEETASKAAAISVLEERTVLQHVSLIEERDRLRKG